MLLRIASIIMGLFLLMGQVYNSAVYGYYQWQFDYFANVLCENQERPELHCDGKCQLAEMLAPAEQKPAPEQLPVFVPSPDLFFQGQPGPLLTDPKPSPAYAIDRVFGLTPGMREVPTPPPRRWV